MVTRLIRLTFLHRHLADAPFSYLQEPPRVVLFSAGQGSRIPGPVSQAPGPPDNGGNRCKHKGFQSEAYALVVQGDGFCY